MRKLDKAYEDIDSKYQKNPEGLKEELKNVETKLASKKELLGKLTKTAPEELVDKTKKEIADLEKRANNLEGYSKYANQIHSIQNIKSRFDTKLQKTKQLKIDIIKSIEEAKNNIKEANEKLADKEYLKTITNEEYNKLIMAPEENKKLIEKQEKELVNIEKSIIKLQSEIGKCDLAWRTLFANKDWDEIQLRVESGKKMTREITEQTPPIKPKHNEKKSKMSQIISNIGRATDTVLNTIGIETIEEEVIEEPELPAKITRWDKVKSFFRNIKDKFIGTKNKEEKSDNELVNTERDEFIEGLRKYADKDCRQEVKKETNEKNKQAHQVKENDNER